MEQQVTLYFDSQSSHVNEVYEICTKLFDGNTIQET